MLFGQWSTCGKHKAPGVNQTGEMEAYCGYTGMFIPGGVEPLYDQERPHFKCADDVCRSCAFIEWLNHESSHIFHQAIGEVISGKHQATRFKEKVINKMRITHEWYGEFEDRLEHYLQKMSQ